MACSAGFILNPEGNQCVDVDECTTRDSICGPQQVCKNKPGGYACVCPAGFVSSNNRNCEDINECVFYKDRKVSFNSLKHIFKYISKNVSSIALSI